MSQGKLIGEEACEVFWCFKGILEEERACWAEEIIQVKAELLWPWTSIFYVAVYVGQRLEPRVAGDPKRLSMVKEESKTKRGRWGRRGWESLAKKLGKILPAYT